MPIIDIDTLIRQGIEIYLQQNCIADRSLYIKRILQKDEILNDELKSCGLNFAGPDEIFKRERTFTGSERPGIGHIKSNINRDFYPKKLSLTFPAQKEIQEKTVSLSHSSIIRRLVNMTGTISPLGMFSLQIGGGLESATTDTEILTDKRSIEITYGEDVHERQVSRRRKWICEQINYIKETESSSVKQITITGQVVFELNKRILIPSNHSRSKERRKAFRKWAVDILHLFNLLNSEGKLPSDTFEIHGDKLILLCPCKYRAYDTPKTDYKNHFELLKPPYPLKGRRVSPKKVTGPRACDAIMRIEDPTIRAGRANSFLNWARFHNRRFTNMKEIRCLATPDLRSSHIRPRS